MATLQPFQGRLRALVQDVRPNAGPQPQVRRVGGVLGGSTGGSAAGAVVGVAMGGQVILTPPCILFSLVVIHTKYTAPWLEE